MNNISTARELLKIARELTGMEFDTEAEKKKYQQEHDVRPGTRLTVKKTKGQVPSTKSQSPQRNQKQEKHKRSPIPKEYRDKLRKLYFDYTGAGEEEDYDKAKFRFVPFLKETRPGGKLESLRPRNGTVLYRGKHPKDKGGGGVIESFSKNPRVAELFKPKGGVIETLEVTPEVLALDFRKVYPGALAAEVIIFRGGHRGKSKASSELLKIARELVSGMLDEPQYDTGCFEQSPFPPTNEYRNPPTETDPASEVTHCQCSGNPV